MVEMSSFSALFSQEILLRIPIYQRGFAWQTQQISDFWEDLIHLNSNNTHYTGMITLKELTKEEVSGWEKERWILDRKYKAYHVVDGQQRLTTFVILINSIIEYAEEHNIKELGIDSISFVREKYICKKHKILKAFKFGYEKDNPSFDYLQYRIFNEEHSGEIDESFYTHNLRNAKDFFDSKLKEYCDGDRVKLDSIYDKLTTSLLFIPHYIDSKFDIHIAFETMNNRGKKLSNLELLKNRLIYLNSLISTSDDYSSYEVNDTREEINRSWGCIYENLGRDPKMLFDKSKSDDELLRTHWIIYFRYSRSKGEDYANSLLHKKFTIRNLFHEVTPEEISETDIDALDDEDRNDVTAENESEETEGFIIDRDTIRKYIASLQKTSVHWYYTSYPKDSKCPYTEAEKQWIERLNRLGMNYFRPLIIASFLNDDVTSEQRVRLFMAVERFVMLIFRMGRFMSTFHSSVYYIFAHMLYENKICADDITYRLNETFIEKMPVCMDTFKARMMELHDKDEGFYSWSPLRYVLFEYEAYLADEAKEPFEIEWEDYYHTDKENISVEHIYPQTPNDPYWIDRFEKYSIDQKNHLTNSLGNLLLLSKSKNSSLQNVDFITKIKGNDDVRGYLNGSRSEREVANDYMNKGWTANAIEERGLKLLSFMEDRWKITFKNESQRYNVLGISFIKDNLSSDNIGVSKLESVKDELLGDYEVRYDLNSNYVKNIYEFDPYLSYLRLVKITYNGEVFKTHVWYEGFMSLMKRLVIDNRQILDSICDVKNSHRSFATITKNSEDEQHYTKLIDDYYVYTEHGGAGFMKEILRFLELADIKDADITIEYAFIKGHEPKE